jgi:hypothetical protein
MRHRLRCSNPRKVRQGRNVDAQLPRSSHENFHPPDAGWRKHLQMFAHSPIRFLTGFYPQENATVLYYLLMLLLWSGSARFWTLHCLKDCYHIYPFNIWLFVIHRLGLIPLPTLCFSSPWSHTNACLNTCTTLPSPSLFLPFSFLRDMPVSTSTPTLLL